MREPVGLAHARLLPVRAEARLLISRSWCGRHRAIGLCNVNHR